MKEADLVAAPLYNYAKLCSSRGVSVTWLWGLLVPKSRCGESPIESNRVQSSLSWADMWGIFESFQGLRNGCHSLIRKMYRADTLLTRIDGLESAPTLSNI